MDAGQNDDLQNAINGIVDSGVPELVPTPTDVETTPDFGVPPAPDAAAVAPEFMEMPTEQPVETVPAEQPTQEAVDAVAESVMNVPAEPITAEAPVEAPAPVGELSDVKQNMIQDLIPLMNQVSSIDETEKYRLYKEAIENTHDKSIIPAAYEAAKGIANEAARAEALLYLIKEAEG
ncbi:hypothetical protein IJI76_01790 [Candidatus Saccharibacteria bacterium]|nr:hypothetical protein [Candidatus Saccharibacteria bacterium]